MDHWLNGAWVVDLAPNLVAKVAACRRKTRMVKDSLARAWLLNCGPDLGEVALAEFFRLWHALVNVQMIPGQMGVLVWR
jgi:hypothetical protein